MYGNKAKKPDFLDEVVDEMGDEDGAKFGADMESEEEVDDETANEDRLMAAKQVAKALGITTVDPQRFSDALKAFIATC